MRTNIEIDETLMNQAKRISGFKTKREIVEAGLKLMVQLKKQEAAKKMFRKIKMGRKA